MSPTVSTDNRSQVEAQARAALPAEVVAFIEACRTEPHPESQVIRVLHKVQAHAGHLSPSAMDAVAQLLRVPAAKVSGIATFYHFFRLAPRGKFVISVCFGTACYVRGAEAIAAKLRDELGIGFGETTSDGMFSLDAARCLGTCGLGPVLMLNGEVHGPMTPDKIPPLLEQCRNAARTLPPKA